MGGGFVMRAVPRYRHEDGFMRALFQVSLRVAGE